MSKLKFWKMHGLGNDFIVFDGVHQTIPFDKNFLSTIADRNFGIGCDQILVIEKSSHEICDFRYRIFNANGSEVEQCGNGARCAALFVKHQFSVPKNPLVFETQRDMLTLNISDNDLVEVDMGNPKFHPSDIPLNRGEERDIYTITVDDTSFDFSAVNIGNPHCIIQVPNLDTAPIKQYGNALSTHADFPKDCNVSFAEVIDASHIRIKTYERGVGETLACGSAACASVIAFVKQGVCHQDNVSVTMPGGELTIRYNAKDNRITMSGPATFVFSGVIEAQTI